MQNPKEIFNHYCKINAMRCTPERNLIIDEIYQLKGHFTIDDLHLRIRNKYPDKKLSRGSIYRTIPHLIRAGLITECFVDQGHSCYEPVWGSQHHEHLKCIQCGKILEFSNKRIDAIERNICKKLQFQIVGHSHILFGYCQQCQKTRCGEMQKLQSNE